MGFWDKVKQDAQKGIGKGISTIKAKADEISDEGLAKLRALELKIAMRREMADLGDLVFKLSATPRSNPLDNAKVKASIEKIRKNENENTSLASGAGAKASAKPQAKQAPKRASKPASKPTVAAQAAKKPQPAKPAPAVKAAIKTQAVKPAPAKKK